MNVTALKIGSVFINLSTGFEEQGFAVTEVTGLSDYGEHKMGIPGSTDVVITGVILPGASPMAIREYIYSSVNPYLPFMIEAIHGENGPVFQALAAITSVKCRINEFPTSIVVTILRRTGWFGAPVIQELTSGESNPTIIPGSFEFESPITLEIQLKSYFSKTDLTSSHIIVSVGGGSSILIKFERIIPVLTGAFIGLFEGCIIRVTNSLDYHACLITEGRVFDLPVLGKVVSGMIPVSERPEVLLEQNLPPACSIGVVLTTRETYLTV